MLAILKPVFESIWKRRETKIFIGLALLTPLAILISTFLPEESNFFKPTILEGSELISATGMVQMINSTASTLYLPILALFYLTFTVFRGETDSRTLFLYKDIKRSDIFWAKIVSLIGIVLIYSVTLISVSMIFYYTRIGHMDYANLNFWSQDSGSNVDFFQIALSEILSLIVCVFLAATLSLKKGLGVTMAASFIYLIVLAVLVNTGFSYLTPIGDRGFDFGNNFFYLVSFGLPALVTLIYSTGLAHLTLKHFKGMEY